MLAAIYVLIILLATAIIGWILAYGDIKEKKQEINELASDLVQEQADKKSPREQVRWLRQLKGSDANLRYDSQQTGQVANKNESENLADRYSSGYLHGNPALSRNVSNTDDGKQVGPRGQGVRRVPEVAAGAGPTPRTEWPRSNHDV